MRLAPLAFLLLLTACDSTRPIPTRSLVGHWPMDNAEVRDQSETGNDGTVFDAKTTAGVVGDAFAFRGAFEYLRIPHVQAYESTTQTISFWFKKSNGVIQNTSGSPFSLEGLVWKAHDTAPDRTFSVSLGGTAPFDLYAKVGDASPDLVTVRADGRIQVGTWHHVALVISRTQLALYLDGERVDTQPFDGPLDLDASPIVVGKASADSRRERYFVGAVDEVRLYTRALEREDVRALSSEGR